MKAAFILTTVGGVALDKMNRCRRPLHSAWATLLGGVAIVGVAGRDTPGTSHVTWRIAIACGVAQLVAAAFPGTSRSGATIMVAIALGLARSEAAEFSFILGMITLIAAGGYKFLGAWRHGDVVGASVTPVTLAFATAAVSAFVVVRWLLQFVRSHSFNGFAIYRILLGIALLLAM